MSVINPYRRGVTIVIGNRARMVAVIVARLRMTMVRLLVALQMGFEFKF